MPSVLLIESYSPVVPLTAKEANKDATVTNNDHDITHITHVLKSESIRLLILPRPLS